jgi:hypothetical protein
VSGSGSVQCGAKAQPPFRVMIDTSQRAICASRVERAERCVLEWDKTKLLIKKLKNCPGEWVDEAEMSRRATCDARRVVTGGRAGRIDLIMFVH